MIVVNNDTGVVIVSITTTVTSQPLPAVQPCQFYKANVTVLSSEYHGDSFVIRERSPGGVCVCARVHVRRCLYAKIILFTIHLEYYHVHYSSQNVGFVMPSTVVFSFELNLKV